VISLHDINKVYELKDGPTIAALHDVSLEIGDAEFLVIIGRSGSGKTTLLNVAAGLTKPTSGSVMLDGTDVWSLSDKEQSRLRNRKLGFVFQFPSLIPTLSALENVMLPVSLGGRNGHERGSHGREADGAGPKGQTGDAGRDVPRDEGKGDGDRAKAIELLETVGLGDRLASFPRQMSAGQQQRVVIARALMNEPEVLMADEPSSDLDEQTETEIMKLFADIHARTGVSIMMVTHASQLIEYGTRAVEMSAGRLRELS
jgi:ABC-type lipoprotein export system ATPase subunit